MSMRVICGAVVLIAACHDSEPELERTSTAPPVVAVAASKPAGTFALGPDLEMRHPIKDGHLTLIPIALTSAPPSVDAVALDDAMSRHLVKVRDLGDYTHVRIKNKSDERVYAMAGEMIVGGEQDHAIADSTIIEPHSSEVVRVYCVEQGRSEGSKWFHPGHAVVDVGLRRVMRHDNQTAVWRQVEADNRRLGLAPPTSTYREAAALQDSAPSTARRTQLAAQLSDDRLVGVAAAYDGEVVAIDRFATPAMFRAHIGELLGSYVAGDDGAHHEGANLSPDAVRRFAADASLTKSDEILTETLARPAAN